MSASSFHTGLVSRLAPGLALALAPQAPDGVENRGGRHVDRPLLGAEPAQQAVAGQPPRERARVGEDRLELESDDQRCEGVDGRDLHFVAAPAREREAVALQAIVRVGPEDDVRRGVVGVDVHGVRSVEVARRREADVERLQVGDRRGHRAPPKLRHRTFSHHDRNPPRLHTRSTRRRVGAGQVTNRITATTAPPTTTVQRSASSGIRRPTVAPSWAPIVEPIAIVTAASHATSATNTNRTAATALATSASTFLSALRRCIPSVRNSASSDISMIPWAAPK